MNDLRELSRHEAAATIHEEPLMDKDNFWNLLSIVIVSAIALLVAYLCFGILSSQANTKIQSYSLGGAIAGFIVSFTVLFSSYLHIRKTTGVVDKLQQQHRTELEKFQQAYKKDTEDLRKRNEELQQKIIRGAPHPLRYDTEVDERQKIVLARPSNWQPKGGVIFNFQLSEEELKEIDQFPASCVITCVPTGQITQSAQSEFYNEVIRDAQRSPFLESHTAEYILVGGEPKAVKCLKIIANRFVDVTVTKDKIRKKTNREWSFMTHDAFNAEMEQILKEQSLKSAAGAAAFVTAVGASLPPAGATTPPAAAGVSTAATGEDIAVPQTSEKAETQEAKADPPVVEHETPEHERYLVKINHMTVFCYHEELSKIFYFDFYDNREDFPTSSEDFNRILESTRFLSN
jgi:hypothetical protein